MKRFHRKNPYRDYQDINNAVLQKDIKQIVNMKFELSHFIQIYEYQQDEYIYLYDRCLM